MPPTCNSQVWQGSKACWRSLAKKKRRTSGLGPLPGFATLEAAALPGARARAQRLAEVHSPAPLWLYLFSASSAVVVGTSLRRSSGVEETRSQACCCFPWLWQTALKISPDWIPASSLASEDAFAGAREGASTLGADFGNLPIIGR